MESRMYKKEEKPEIPDKIRIAIKRNAEMDALLDMKSVDLNKKISTEPYKTLCDQLAKYAKTSGNKEHDDEKGIPIMKTAIKHSINPLLTHGYKHNLEERDKKGTLNERDDRDTFYANTTAIVDDYFNSTPCDPNAIYVGQDVGIQKTKSSHGTTNLCDCVYLVLYDKSKKETLYATHISTNTDEASLDKYIKYGVISKEQMISPIDTAIENATKGVERDDIVVHLAGGNSVKGGGTKTHLENIYTLLDKHHISHPKPENMHLREWNEGDGKEEEKYKLEYHGSKSPVSVLPNKDTILGPLSVVFDNQSGTLKTNCVPGNVDNLHYHNAILHSLNYPIDKYKEQFREGKKTLTERMAARKDAGFEGTYTVPDRKVIKRCLLESQNSNSPSCSLPNLFKENYGQDFKSNDRDLNSYYYKEYIEHYEKTLKKICKDPLTFNQKIIKALVRDRETTDMERLDKISEEKPELDKKGGLLIEKTVNSVFNKVRNNLKQKEQESKSSVPNGYISSHKGPQRGNGGPHL